MRTALQHFIDWLPGELEYSVAKAPYPTKLERATLQSDDPRSIVGFLGAEWHHAQLLAENGAHHADQHQKTAQLQFAKFAAGIFDTYGLVDWLQMGKPDDLEIMKRSAHVAATRAIPALRHPSSLGSTGGYKELVNAVDYRLPFAFAFEEDLSNMQRGIVETAEGSVDLKSIGELKRSISNLGVRATAGYLNYAQTHLSVDEFLLAPSQLAE